MGANGHPNRTLQYNSSIEEMCCRALINITHLLVSLSGGVDVILQELGLDLMLQVSEQSIISLLQMRGAEKIVCYSKIRTYLHVILYISISLLYVLILLCKRLRYLV